MGSQLTKGHGWCHGVMLKTLAPLVGAGFLLRSKAAPSGGKWELLRGIVGVYVYT
jgi:hypothetical protein